MGLWLLRRGKFEQSEYHFSRAVETLTERNPNPYDCEAFYHLGMALQMQDKTDQAYEPYYRCIWNAPWQDAAYLQLARLALRKGDENEGLNFIDKSLIRNQHNQTARHLKCAILRRLGQLTAALSFAKESLEIDPFSMGCRYEIFLILALQKKSERAGETLADIKRTMRGNVHHYCEYASDYSQGGLYREATDFLWLAIENPDDTYPMLYYYLGYFAHKQNNMDRSPRTVPQSSSNETRLLLSQ